MQRYQWIPTIQFIFIYIRWKKCKEVFYYRLLYTNVLRETLFWQHYFSFVWRNPNKKQCKEILFGCIFHSCNRTLHCNAVTFHQAEFKEHMCCMFLSFTKSLRLDFSHLLFGSFQCIYCTEMQGLKDFKTSDLHTHTPSVALSKLLSICPCNTLLNM